MKIVADDAELVSRCKRELPYRHLAFEQLVMRHQNRVYTLCYRMVGNAAAAEDLTQEVFTKVFLNLNSFEERSAFSSWLYRIAHNHSLNFLDKRKRESEGMSAYAEERDARRLERSPEKLPAYMQRILDELSEEQRSILILKYVLELELAEVAQVLEVTVGAVKMRLLRAREAFRRLHQEQASVGTEWKG
ncbi:MAG: RNA polymerase sigma factor [Blastocatellia bacterium]